MSADRSGVRIGSRRGLRGPRLGAGRRRRRAQPARHATWPHDVTREWAWGGSDGDRRARVHRRQRRGRATIRSSAASTARSRRSRAPDGEPSRRRRRRRRRQRPRDRVRRDHPRRSRPAARSRACACSARTSAARAADLLAGLAWAVDAALRRRQPQPVDAQARGRARPARARRPRPTSAARCWSRARTTCPWRASRGASRPCCRWPATPGADPFEIHCNARAARSSSTRAAWTSRWPGRGGETITRDRQLLRDAAPRRAVRAHPRRPPRADALPGQAPAVPDRDERGGRA